MAKEFTGTAEVLKDGTVRMYTKPTIPDAGEHSDWIVFRRLEDKLWRMVSSQHRIADPARQNRSVSMHEQWADGQWPRYIQEVKQNLGEGILLSRASIDTAGVTTTFFRNERLPYMLWNAVQYAATSEVTYLHSFAGDYGDMLSFELIPVRHKEWVNTWTNGVWNIASGGYPYGKGNLEPPAEPDAQYEVNGEKFTIGWMLPLNSNHEVLDSLPSLFVTESKDGYGNYVETIRSFGGTIQFVYSRLDIKKLIQRTCRYKWNGQWVITTTRFETLNQWVLDLVTAKGLTISQYSSEQNPSGFYMRFVAETPERHWAIDTNPAFKQFWSGTITLEFVKIGAADGIDQFSLQNLKSNVLWWHCRDRGGWSSTGNQPLSTLGVTEADFQAVVSKWNEKAVLDPE
jgi:hypothetical protein